MNGLLRLCAWLTPAIGVALASALFACSVSGCASGAREAGAGVEADPGGGPLTVAEASDYTRTARYDDVVAFLDDLADQSDVAHLDSIGRTFEGREIPLAVVADPPVRTAEEARRDPRLVVLLFGNIHAGEVCGKEALLMLGRELALTPDHPLLDDLIVCLIPIYNADGNERFAPDNRPGQVGPEQMGQRANAQGLDLNRDYIKLEAPETRALVRFCHEWDPTIVVDAHTTNGSLHQYTLTYQGPKHPAGDRILLERVRDEVLPAIDRMFERSTGYDSFFYGNFTRDHTRWVTYPAAPHYGAAYRGLRNRIGILSEAYAYATFRDRVLATLGFCRSVLEHAARHANELDALSESAMARTTAAGKAASQAPPAPVRVEAVPFDEPVTLLGYEESVEKPEGQPLEGPTKAYRVAFVNDFAPALEVPRAWAYVIPSGMERIAEHLRLHGVRVDRLDKDAEAFLETYEILEFDRLERPFQGHRMIRNVQVRKGGRREAIPAGAFLVRTGQPYGALASYMLEPQAESGLVAWNFFDDALEAGGAFPVHRVPQPPDVPFELRAWSP